MTQELILTRGVPASGKSTYARRWVMEDPDSRVRVNRDDIREELYGKEYHNSAPDPDKENRVTMYEHNRIKAALSSGKSVIVDNTNLNTRFLKPYYQLASQAGLKLGHKDFPIPVEEAIRRNAGRERKVPEDVIRRMYNNLGPNGQFHHFDGSYPTKPFTAPEKKELAVLVDLDGSLHDIRGVRHFVRESERRKNFDAFHRGAYFCPPNESVKRMVMQAHERGLKIVITTARDEMYREVSQKWLDEQGIPYDNIIMRARNDQRKDYVVKDEMYNNLIKDHYNVVGAIDDNPQAIQAWEQNGIRVTKVPGFHEGEVPENEPIIIDNVFDRGACIRCGRALKGPGPLGPDCAKFY